MFAVNFPSADALESIYSQVLSGHLQQQPFSSAVLKTGPAAVKAAIALHRKMAHNFLPTAIKFHYIFNLRDLSNVFQVGQIECSWNNASADTVCMREKSRCNVCSRASCSLEQRL